MSWRSKLPAAGRASLGIGGFLLLIVATLAITGTMWTPRDPYQLDISNRLAPPWSAGHPLGTDAAGRDVLSELMAGAKNSLLVAATSTLIALIAGVIVGGIAAVSAGWIDDALMRLTEVLYAFPAVILAVILSARLGPSNLASVFAISIFFAPTTARLVRGVSLQYRAKEWVLAARAYGRPSWFIYGRQVIPNISSMLIVQATLMFGFGILIEASLSFLGLGAQPPEPSWGRMLRDAQSYLPVQPFLALWPGLAIVLTVLGINLLGDGLRDMLEPRARGQR